MVIGQLIVLIADAVLTCNGAAAGCVEEIRYEFQLVSRYGIEDIRAGILQNLQSGRPCRDIRAEVIRIEARRQRNAGHVGVELCIQTSIIEPRADMKLALGTEEKFQQCQLSSLPYWNSVPFIAIVAPNWSAMSASPRDAGAPVHLR